MAASNYHYGQFTPEHLEKIAPGVKLFNQQKYWECHEVLEDLWAEDTQDPARNVYWAIIQVAASCIHFRDKNPTGTEGMLNKAKEKFRRVRELRVYTDLMEKLDWNELEDLAMRDDFEGLFKFRFKHYL